MQQNKQAKKANKQMDVSITFVLSCKNGLPFLFSSSSSNAKIRISTDYPKTLKSDPWDSRQSK